MAEHKRLRGRLVDDGERPNEGKKLKTGRPSNAEKAEALKRPRRGNRYSHKLRQSHWEAVQFYIQGFDEKTSLLKAGFSESYASKRQASVFDREDVKQVIREERWKMKSRRHKLQDKVTDEYAKIGFFNIGRILRIDENGDLIYDFSDVTEDDLAAIGEVTVETYVEGRGEDAKQVKRLRVKPYDKKGALDSLARTLGMFKDNLDITSGGMSLEERLQAGRRRLMEDDVVDAEFHEVGGQAALGARAPMRADDETGEDIGYHGGWPDDDEGED